MKKTIMLFLLLMMFIPFIVNAKTCDSDKVTISSVTIDDISDNVEELDDLTVNGRTISLSLSMLDVGDYIKYKVIVNNDSNEDYELNKNSFSINSNYIDYSFSTKDDNIIKAKSSKTIYLKILYKNEVPNDAFKNGVFNDNKTMIVNLSTGKMKNVLNTLKNPKTGVQLLILIIFIILLLGISIYILLRKKMFVKTLVLIVGLSIIIPMSVYAICSCDIKIESRIQIGSSVIYPSGKSKKTVVVGDIVKIGNEEFYVVSNDGKKLTLLTHYNLKVGNIYTIRNNSVLKIGEYTSDDEGYGLQSSEVRGYVGGQNDIRNGTVKFSDSIYWSNKVGEGMQYPGDFCIYSTYTPGTKCAYIYDSNSSIKQYVDAYKKELEEKGVRIKEARLLKVEEAYALGCGKGSYSGSCKESPANAPSWVYETTYWLGSAISNSEVWYIISNGGFGSYYNNDNMYGIRPVIVI